MEATFTKFNKKSIFQNFISRTLELRPLNSATHIFTGLQRLLTISDHGRIAGVCCPNQIKNHHFEICRVLTSYLSLNFIITINHTELQSPRGRRFCLLCWSTFYGTVQGYTKLKMFHICHFKRSDLKTAALLPILTLSWGMGRVSCQSKG